MNLGPSESFKNVKDKLFAFSQYALMQLSLTRPLAVLNVREDVDQVQVVVVCGQGCV